MRTSPAPITMNGATYWKVTMVLSTVKRAET